MRKKEPRPWAGFVLSGSTSSRSLKAGSLPRSTDSIVSCGPFQGPLAPFQKGPGSYRRWRVFHAEPSCCVHPRGQNLHVDPGFSKVHHRSVPTDHRVGGPLGTLHHALTPEKHSAIRRQNVRPRKKVNARWPRASTHKSPRRGGEKAPMPRFGGLTDCFFRASGTPAPRDG